MPKWMWPIQVLAVILAILFLPFWLAFGCPEGCTQIDKNTCACEAKDESAYQPTVASTDTPRRGQIPEWQSGDVKADDGVRAVEASTDTAHDYVGERTQQ